MNAEEYKASYLVNPTPKPRYQFTGAFYPTLYYEDYAAAVEFYTRVLGIPGYQEGEGTRGWQIGEGWLTLLRGQRGNPANIELMLEVGSIAEAERLHGSMLQAGASGTEPVDQIMYQPIRYCHAIDPFGVDIVIFCQR